MELLYVRSPFQRQGVATAMVRWGINRLIEADCQELFSAYHICNAQSRQWHHRLGFQDVHSLFYIRLRLAWLNHEIGRREKLGTLAGLEPLIQERDQWQSQLGSDDW